MRPAYMTALWPLIVNDQIVIIMLPYVDVVLTIAWIGIPYIVIVGEVIHRPCVEIPVCVIVPWPPCVVCVVFGDGPEAGQR